MAFSTGKNSVTFKDITDKITDAELVHYYLGVTNIPCFINSPLRKDAKPSFGLYSNDGSRIYWTDLATKEGGGIYDLLSLMWQCNYNKTLERIQNDLPKFIGSSSIDKHSNIKITNTKIYRSNSELQCKIREWRDYDIKYWESYGITLPWLKYAEVYPISHKIIISDNKKYIFGADKYAYAYVEHKEGKVTLKIYQPFNKNGYKWANKHDNSVISLWTKIPKQGDRVCICSSLKDALCLWCNTGIPSLAIQGEGYKISETAINELNKRYNKVFILFDNDEAGLLDGEKLSEQTGFINIVLPKFEEYNNPKDISDLYYTLPDKNEFKNLMIDLFKNF
jgi:hypothetical protein